MSKRVEHHLDLLFSQAEDDMRLLVPENETVRRALTRRIADGEVVRVARGIYARKEHWSSLPVSQQSRYQIRTLQQIHPDWVFCGPTAALMYGLPVSYGYQETIHVAKRDAHRRPDSRLTQHKLPSATIDNITVVYGARVTSIVRTAFDCARIMDFRNALAVIDAVLRQTNLSAGELEQRFRTIARNIKGSRKAIRVARYGNPSSESAGESMARAAMIQQGFVEPQLQAPFQDPLTPGREFFADFFWPTPKGGIIGEFDGYSKYIDQNSSGSSRATRTMIKEKHRESSLSLYRLPILRLSYDDLRDDRRLVNLLESFEVPRKITVAVHVRRAPEGSLSFEFTNVLSPDEYFVAA